MITKDLDQKFRKLFQDGKLVQIHISKWGMCCQLSENDLKLPEGQTLPAFFRLGKKMLIEDDIRNAFTRLDVQARTYLKMNSHKFPIADAHFVPRKKIIEVLAQLNEFKEEYLTLTQGFILGYEGYKANMLAQFPSHTAIIEPYYPAIQSLTERFAFSVSVFEVAVPQEFKELSIAEVHAQNETVDGLKERYQTQMQEQYKHALTQMDSFVKEAACSLRGQLVEVFDNIAKKINNKEVLNVKNINSIRKIISDFDALEFFDDSVVKDKLQTVKALVDSTQDYRDNHGAIDKLRLALTEVIVVTKDMSDLDSMTGDYFRNIDLD